MTENKNAQNRAGELRRHAEKMSREEAPDIPEDLEGLSLAAVRKLLHELRVHQIELEMQNEDLRTAQEKLEEAHAQYFELYDVAPVGYFSISDKGLILEANLTGANLLQMVPLDLRAQRFTHFIYKDDQDVYYPHRKELFETRAPQVCEMRMVRSDGTLIWVSMEATLAQDGKSGKPVCRAAISGVTERKRVEEALRASEEKNRVLFNNEIYAILIFDLETLKLLDVNDTYCRMYGYSREELLSGMTIHDITAEHQVSDAATQQAINEGTIFIPLRYHRKKDGTVFTVEIVGGPYVWQGRKVMFALIHDITDRISSETERKQAEEMLRREQLMLERTEGIANIGSWEWDVETDTVTWSDELFRIFQRDPKEGAPSFAEHPAFYHPDDMARLQQAVEAAIADGTPYELELRAIRKDGETRVCLGRGIAENTPGGQVVRLFGSVQDITDHKRAEEALRESEEKYRNLVELLHEGIWAIDEDARTTYVNTHMAEMLGYTVEEMQGKELFSFMDARGRELAAQNVERRREGISETHDFEFLRKDGTRIFASLSTTPVTGKDGKYKGALAGVQDITDHKRLEEEQRRVEKLESVGLLAGGIAHDFNNILTSILGNISLASMEAEPGSELQESLEQAEKASQRAKALTVQLLTFSKGGAPVLKLASLTELLKDTAGFALSGSKVKCNFSIPPGLWHAEIDAGQVSQVIHNLVINAQQAMPTGGSIEISAENIALSETQSLGRELPLKSGNYVRVSVADHGTGIPRDHLEKVFDPFFTTKQKGNGMGLATSFSIARQHGGHISVESELGSGSTFYLYLPASTQTSTPKGDKKETIKPADKARILVMDDEKGVREIAGRMLKHIGYKDIEFAEDGAEAIKLYQAAMESGNPFNVAILDLTIAGGMGGEIAIQKLLKIDPGVKAIVSSGYIDDPAIAKFREYGFSGVVAKPYTIEELRKAVQDVIG